jgi:hypothetical protein
LKIEFLFIFFLASALTIAAYRSICEAKSEFRWFLKLIISVSLIAGMAVFFETAISKTFELSTILSLCIIVPLTEETARLIALEYMNTKDTHSAFTIGYFFGFFETVLFIFSGLCSPKMLAYRFFFTQPFHGFQAITIHKRLVYFFPAVVFHSLFNFATYYSGQTAIVVSLIAFWLSLLFAIFSKKDSKL